LARIRKTDQPDVITNEDAADTPESLAEVVLPEPDPMPEPSGSFRAPPSDALKASAPPPRRRGLSVLLGGALAALVGVGATVYALPRLPEGLQSLILPPAATTSEADAVQDALLKTLDGEVRTLRAAQGAPDLSGIETALADLSSRLQVLEAAGTAQGEALGGLAGRVDALESRPVAGGGAPTAAVEALKRDIEALRSQIGTGGAGTEAIRAEVAAAAEAATARMKDVEAEAARLAEASRETARLAAARAALSHLEAALESGAPIAGALADLAATGVEVPAALGEQSGGIPAQAALAGAFTEAARDALSISLRETAGEGFWSRSVAFLKSQSGARSLAPRDGTDPDAVLSRAEAALGAGDLAGAIAELDGLPEAGKARMAEWVALAQRRLAALAALPDISAQID
jgi:hypothetical protein